MPVFVLACLKSRHAMSLIPGVTLTLKLLSIIASRHSGFYIIAKCVVLQPWRGNQESKLILYKRRLFGFLWGGFTGRLGKARIMLTMELQSFQLSAPDYSKPVVAHFSKL
jgi:hypothetical protein